MASILITNGRIIDPANHIDRTTNLLIEDGVIVEVTPDLPETDETLDATRKVVCPGFVDIHVHFREPGGEGAETLETGLAAAAAGGFTTVACMPNTFPPIDEPALVRQLTEKSLALGGTRLGVIATVTRGQQGKGPADYGALAQAGAVAFSDDGLPVADPDMARVALEASRELGLPVVSHCEGCDMTNRGSMHAGAVSKKLGISGMSRAGEYEMVRRDIQLAEQTGGHIHIAHVSTVESAEAIRSAKKRGVHVTAEVTPHHLTLTDAEIKSDRNTVFKMNPPLREMHDVVAMHEALVDGTFDAIACDHAPHSAGTKSLEFERAPFGIIGLESVLPVVTARLVDEGVLTLSRMVELLTHGPARAFGLDCGAFHVGAPADVTIFDPDVPYDLDVTTFRSKSRNCPFDGWRVRGRVVEVLVGGRTVYHG